MCVSIAMAKYVISAGSALAPHLHEKYPFRSAFYLIYLFFLPVLFLPFTSCLGSATCQRRRLYAPTALSPTNSHTRTTLDGHWLHLNNAFNHPSGRVLRIEMGKQRIFSFFLFIRCLQYCRRHDNRIHRLLPSTKKKMRVSGKRPISLSSLFNVLLPST